MSPAATAEDLHAIIGRELRGLQRQVQLYPDDASLWAQVPGIPNPGGTLALHLVGNLRTFIGATLGGSGYVRDRNAEFADRGISRAEIVQRIDATRSEILHTLKGLDAEALARPYTFPNGASGGTGRFLTHLAVHLGYHLGQIDYHRRVVTGDSASAGMLPLGELLQP